MVYVIYSNSYITTIWKPFLFISYYQSINYVSFRRYLVRKLSKSVAARPPHLNEGLMKKIKNNQIQPSEADMLPEYNFTGKKGVRGKYHRFYQQGHTVKVSQDDGSVATQYFALEDGAVMLEPDVREYFPSSESVNQALRSLIALKPGKPAKPPASSK